MRGTLLHTFCLIFLLGIHSLAQQPSTKPSTFLPQNLGPVVNTEYAEINPVLSPNGKILFFNRVNHPENYYGKHDSQDIYYSHLQSDGSWSTARRLEAPFNQARHNAIICALSDDTYLIDGIFTKGNIPRWRKRGFSVVTVTGDQWSKPQALKMKGYSRLNEGIESNAWMSSDKKVMILSYTHHYNGKRNNLYVSFNNGEKWSKPKKLNKVVNTRKTNEEAPFISYDNESLYFTSNRDAKTRKERKHQYNIYKSNRLDESWKLWSTPMPLSDTINSQEWDSYFRTTQKGSWAYFASTKNAIGQSDLFKIKLFEENPFLEVKGHVINAAKHRPLGKGKKFIVLADGQPIDSIWINLDSSNYKIKLPLGKQYSIAASVPHYKSLPEVIDVSHIREFTQLEKDLLVEPLPHVLVSGNLLIQNPRGIIPESSNPRIVINGTPVDTVKITYPEGKYEIALPYGKSYSVSVKAVKYVSDPVKWDFTKVDEYEEIKKDLFVKSNPIAIVKGSFLVKGTNAQLPTKAHPRLLVNGEIVDTAQIDTLHSTFRIALPLKKDYTLSVVATKYQGFPENLILSAATESVELTRNLFASPVSTSAVLSGIIINRKTNKPITTKEAVKIQSNGTDIPTAKFDPATGNYEVELGLGAVHTVNASIHNYFPQYETVDLSKQKGNVKVLKDLYVTPLEVGQSVKLNNIFFETGKSTLKPKSFPELNKVVKFLNENPAVDIQIEGHTDNVGKSDANMKLSRWRARAVQQYLVTRGIDVKRVKFEGFGQTKPVAKNTTAVGKSLNRRVEFKILSVD